MISISSATQFDGIINSPKLTVVDFHAVWCGPCKAVAPRFESLSKQYKNCEFVKVDVDQCPEVSKKCSVTAMPTFHLYKSGKRIAEVVGADISQVERLVAQHSSGTSGGFPGAGGRVLGSGKAANPSNGASEKQQQYLMYGLFLAFLVYLYMTRSASSSGGNFEASFE